MLNIINPSTNPYFNLALEEYFLTSSTWNEDLLILWQNQPTIVVGKHQNSMAEINYDFVKTNDIPVVRRLSGGGAVYHDLGNLNFTFIIHDAASVRNDFSFFAQPVIHTLKQLGVDAAFTGRNDITINGQKFSGNAQYFSRNKMLHHGTLLYDTDFRQLAGALTVEDGKYKSKAVKSSASPVTNIRPLLRKPLTIAEFRNILARNIFELSNQPYQEYHLTETDREAIQHLVETRYMKWEWNYGASPSFNFQYKQKFAGGTIQLGLTIADGKITACKFYGDFFAKIDISELENRLLNEIYEERHISDVLYAINADQYFYNISNQELLSCFFPSKP